MHFIIHTYIFIGWQTGDSFLASWLSILSFYKLIEIQNKRTMFNLTINQKLFYASLSTLSLGFNPFTYWSRHKSSIGDFSPNLGSLPIKRKTRFTIPPPTLFFKTKVTPPPTYDAYCFDSLFPATFFMADQLRNIAEHSNEEFRKSNFVLYYVM